MLQLGHACECCTLFTYSERLQLGHKLNIMPRQPHAAHHAQPQRERFEMQQALEEAEGTAAAATAECAALAGAVRRAGEQVRTRCLRHPLPWATCCIREAGNPLISI